MTSLSNGIEKGFWPGYLANALAPASGRSIDGPTAGWHSSTLRSKSILSHQAWYDVTCSPYRLTGSSAERNSSVPTLGRQCDEHRTNTGVSFGLGLGRRAQTSP